MSDPMLPAKKITPAKKTTKRKSSRTLPKGEVNFKLYISKILKNKITKQVGIQSKASGELNSALNVIGKALAASAANLAKASGKETVSSREVQSAVQMIFPEEMAKHAVSEGSKAVTKNDATTATKKMSVAKRSGLVIPPARVRVFLKDEAKRVGSMAPIYLAAVLEYFTSDLLELASNAAWDRNKKTISSSHIFMAANNEEIESLFRHLGIILSSAAVMPNVHQALTSKLGKKKVKKAKTKGDVKAPHRFRPGTVALRSIRKQQKTTECVYFPKQVFDRLAREIACDDEMRLSEDAVRALQMFTEQELVGMLNRAQLASLHANRQRVIPGDIKLARRMCLEC
jgi:histone H3/H4